MPRGKSNLSNQLAGKYYTPQEAMQRLGMDRDSFNNYVRRGTIKKETFIGKHGFFSVREIDALAAQIESAILTANTTSLKMRAATKDDLPSINSMAYLNFGELSRSSERIEARKRFLEANPGSTFALLDGNTVVASLDIVPMKHEAIERFREGVRGWTFPNKMIEQWEPGRRIEAIVIDFMTTTLLPPDELRKMRRKYARTLLSQFADMLVEWGSKGIDIKSIDACGGFEDGRHILKTGGFVSLGIKGNNREIFTLDVDRSDLQMLRPYKEALSIWKAQHM